MTTQPEPLPPSSERDAGPDATRYPLAINDRRRRFMYARAASCPSAATTGAFPATRRSACESVAITLIPLPQGE
jgi:hypothetical protein